MLSEDRRGRLDTDAHKPSAIEDELQIEAAQ
jgi:hypothetical protein